MENSKNQKLGGGLTAVTIILLILSVLSFLSYIFFFIAKGIFSKIPALKSIFESLPTGYAVVLLIATAAMFVGTILILSKKVIGVYAYFAGTIVEIVFVIIANGFAKGLSNLILYGALSVVMYLLLLRKKELFGFKSKSNKNISA